MISLEGIVFLVLKIIVGGLVCGLLWFLVNYLEKEFPGGAIFWKFARIAIVVLGVIFLILVLLSLVSGRPILV